MSTGHRARLVAALAVAASLLVAACGGGDASLPELDAALGGALTREAGSQNAFNLPAPGLTDEERRAFEVGDSFFTKNWVTAPASTEARDGLGPLMNAQACSSCHVRDGRGAPPEGPADTSTLGLLLRLSVPGTAEDGSPLPEPVYGSQLQDRAVLGVEPEGRVLVTWHTSTGTYDDGTEYELRWPYVAVADPAYGTLDPDVMVSARLAPQVIGVGLLEAIPDADLDAAADPDDADGDGISGRRNVGRFGWKAGVATVAEQVASAFHGDLGITSSLVPDMPCGPTQTACAASPDGGSPEVEDDTFDRIVFYNRTLSVPAMRDHEAPDVRRGATLFESIGCAACHTPTQRTGPSDIDVLADQTFHPYTDLLLHDMGEELTDNRPEFRASAREWRTPPLWGLGLHERINGRRFLLHDGRARTIEEAILWHGGEGEASMLGFKALSAAERRQLLRFLESL